MRKQTRQPGRSRVIRAEAAVLAATAAIVAAALVRVILLVQPIGGDPALYAYVGSRILAGELPYRDVFEQKPPGILYTYATGFAVFGRSMVSVQVLDGLAWMATLVFVWRLTMAMWNDRALALGAAAITAVLISPNLQSSFKQVAQAETFLMPWTAAAMWLAVRSGDTPRRWLPPALGAGACCGAAFLYKYNAITYLGAAAVTMIVGEVRRWPLGRLAALGLGFAAPVAVAVGYFWIRGALPDFIDATVRYNLAYTSGSYASSSEFAARAAVMTWRFATMNVLWFVGGLGLLMAPLANRRLAPLVLFLAAAYIAMLLNAKFYPQYFLQLLPPLAIAAAIAAVDGVRLWRAHRARRAATVAAVLLLALVGWVGRHLPIGRVAAEVAAATRYATGRLARDDYYLRFGGYANAGDFSMLADDRLARRLREATRPDESVYIYGGEALVLFLADRRAASRFVWNDPFLAEGYAGRYTTGDLIAELQMSRPAYFIVLKNDQNLVDPVDSLTHYQQDPTLRAYVAAHYRDVGWLEDFWLFERLDRRRLS